MFLTLFYSAVVAAGISAAYGQSSCNTPSGVSGECISIYDCGALLKLVQTPNRTPEQLTLLQKSQCGYQGDTVMVCCPPECSTPDGNPGKCVDIYSCPQIANRLRKPVSQENKLYVQKSKCEGPTPTSVCCPQTGSTTNAGGPKPNINEICSSKQTAFPPDPKSGCCGYDSKIGNKIIGGEATTVDQYPWLVPIKYQRNSPGGNDLLCGGVLISSRYVLTAAHCVGNYALKVVGRPIAVIAGEYDTSHPGKDCMPVEAGGIDCTDGEVVIEIERLIPHPDYEPATYKNDIALIRLRTSAPFTEFIRPICLPTYDITLNPPPPPQNFTLYAAGWGATENETNSVKKLHVGLPYVELNQCQQSYNGPFLQVNLWDRQMCAGGQPGKDTCKGDSGGPLMYEKGGMYQVHGVINFGPKPCAQANIPGVYAKVFSYLDWIRNTITT